MKKTIAKMMAAAMLVASMPAMVMPTFTVNAEESVSVSQIPASIADNVCVNGTLVKVTETPEVNLDNAGVVAAGSFKLNVQLLKQVGADMSQDGKQFNYAKKYEFKPNEYKDETAAVKKIATDDQGYVVITFDAAKLDQYKTNTILKAQAPKNIWMNLNGKTFAIPVGKQISTTKDTKFTGVGYTEDGNVKTADVTIDTAGNATIVKMPTDVKKVTMLKQNVDASDIYLAGISFPVEKFDDQAFKSAKMKTMTAKNIKHLGSGALRNCKKLRKVRMGNAKMRKIHANAFYDCEKLKNIKINCKNLKAVGNKAFKKLKKGCTITIKASAKKYKAVVKMIKKSGTDKVKFKKA